MNKKWILVIVALVVIGAVASRGRQASHDVEAKTTEQHIEEWRQDLLREWADQHKEGEYLVEATPALLCQAYARNEVAADRDYKGKWVRLTGRLDSISSGVGGKPYLTFNVGTVDQVQAYLYKMQVGPMRADKTYTPVPASDKAADLAPGQAVVLECRGQGATLGIPQLDLCIITPDS